MPTPPDRDRTVRQALLEALREGPLTAHELSQRAHVRERDVPDHLAHLARSLLHAGEQLRTVPAACLDCGYVFRDRQRAARPTACPRCRSTHLDPPAFLVEPGP